jgi:hypothetical protein
MTTRPTYEPPFSRDLSELNVSGQVGPQGICMPGGAISGNFTCTRGTSPVSNPATCSPVGSNPKLGGCSKGNSAFSSCQSGSTD